MTSDNDRMARAGDYVLGLLDDAERERAERDLERDPEFRAAVLQLAAHMFALDRTAAPRHVPDGMWAAVEAQITRMPQMQAVARTMRDGPLGIGRASIGGRRRPVGGPLGALGGWRGLAVAAGLLAAVGVGFFTGREFAVAPRPIVVVVLDAEDQRPGAIFEAYGDATLRIVPLRDFPVPAGKILQVWTLYDQAIGPVSLGTLERAEVTHISGPSLPTPRAEQLYEITLEDAPGSPTGRPTGPILVKGFATRPPL